MGRVTREQEKEDLRASLLACAERASEGEILSLTVQEVKRETVQEVKREVEMVMDGKVPTPWLVDTGVRILQVTWTEGPGLNVSIPALYSDDEDSDEFAGLDLEP